MNQPSATSCQGTSGRWASLPRGAPLCAVNFHGGRAPVAALPAGSDHDAFDLVDGQRVRPQPLLPGSTGELPQGR